MTSVDKIQWNKFRQTSSEFKEAECVEWVGTNNNPLEYTSKQLQRKYVIAWKWKDGADYKTLVVMLDE